MSILNTKITAALIAAAAIATPSLLAADEIALTFTSPEFTVTGDFAGVKDGAYLIIHEGVTIHVPVAMVSCTGEHCLPATTVQAADS